MSATFLQIKIVNNVQYLPFQLISSIVERIFYDTISHIRSTHALHIVMHVLYVDRAAGSQHNPGSTPNCYSDSASNQSF